jgi:CubicO group peptidase (beta-lactamase class C family)
MDKFVRITIGLFLGFLQLLEAQENKKSRYFTADSIVELGIQKKAFPGAQLLIAKGDTLHYVQSFGYHTYDSIVRVKNSDLYDLASVTKVLAGTLAFMKLYELYNIDLNEPVSNYLTYLKRGTKKKSTFKEVLSHSAGWIPYIAHQNLVRRKNGTFKARTLSNKFSEKYPQQVSDSLYLHKNYSKKIIRRIKKTKVSNVGQYKYSGLWFFLLPELTKKLSGLSFESFLKKYFYEPLELERLTFLPSKHFPKNEIVPTEYDSLFRRQVVQGWVHDEAAALMGGISGNAGLFANASSISPLLKMLMNNGTYQGKSILNPETVALFTQKAYPKRNNRRGLGFDKPDLTDTQNPYPSALASELSYGHSGFTGTFIWVDPSKKSFLIFLSNRVYPSRKQREIYELNIREKLLDYVLQN